MSGANCDLTPAVLAELGLDRQPFTEVDRDEVFLDTGGRTLIDRILHNLTYGDMLLLLLGPTGSGKTALVLALLEHLPGRLELFVARGQENLSGNRILRDMLSSVQAKVPEEPGEVVNRLFDHLSQTAAKDIPAALVIDDADRIRPDELENLLGRIDEINAALAAPLHLMLVGQADLESILARVNARALVEGRVFSTQVRPLSREQCRQFIQHRLSCAGAQHAPPLSETQWDAAYASSGGIPGRLQSAVAWHLNSKAGASRPEDDAQAAPPPPATARPAYLQRWPLIGIGAMLAALVLLWLIGGGEPDQQNSRRALALPAPGGNPAEDAASGERATRPPAPPVARASPPARANAEAAPAPVPRPATAAAAEPVASVPVEPSNPAPGASAAPTAGPASAQPAPAPEAAAAAPQPVARTAPPVAEPPARQARAANPAPGKPAPIRPARGEPEPKPLATAPPDLHGHDWLLRQPGESYTLQVLALGDRQAVIDFAVRRSLDRESPAALFATRHQGGDWYVLVLGIYPDKAQARTALARLPRAIRRNGPWMRSLASIHGAIGAD